MTALAMVVWGAGVGAGVWLCLRAAHPRPRPISMVLAQLERPGRSITSSTDARSVGTWAGRSEAAIGVVLARLDLERADDADLALAGRSPERHMAMKLASALAGFLGSGLVGATMVAAGLAPSTVVVALLCLVAAAFGFLLPDLTLRDEAARRRRAFRHALSAYLDLVNVLLAGGAGIETALFAAADAGDGWSFEYLRTALDRARRTGRSPWDTLTELAASLRVDELAELAASVSLAGSHGARIRSSLAAKADALRGHQLADTEAAAESASERMTIPLAVLLFGFLVLIGYPAIQQITTSTTGA